MTLIVTTFSLLAVWIRIEKERQRIEQHWHSSSHWHRSWGTDITRFQIFWMSVKSREAHGEHKPLCPILRCWKEKKFLESVCLSRSAPNVDRFLLMSQTPIQFHGVCSVCVCVILPTNKQFKKMAMKTFRWQNGISVESEIMFKSLHIEWI